MPIIERDPWRAQYFERVSCPDDVVIPTDDETAWALWPRHRWIYNKLSICESQDIPAAPHGVEPPGFPVFSKPIYNMGGMGVDGHVIRSDAELARHIRAGHMWMELLEGRHVSTDVIIVDGEALWWRHTVGHPLGQGMFDRWTVLAGRLPAVEAYCGQWLRAHLKGYTGAANLETIGGRLIEAHLRFSDQWPDLYGPGWVEAVVELYARGCWRYRDRRPRTGHSVVLFGPHGIRPTAPPEALVTRLLAARGVSSIQLTFHEDREPALHAMPPGGFRLAVINGWDLRAGLQARRELAAWFRVTPQPVHASARRLLRAG